jgi:hypothetical protein
MNNNINSFDCKYNHLVEMLVYKKNNPPKISYSPPFRMKGIIYKIQTDLHNIGTLYEQFTYNSNNDLIHYHKGYDLKTIQLKYKHWKLKIPRINKN